MGSIPADFYVSTNDQVIAPGGTGLEMIGLFLTNNARVPFGTVLSFPNAVGVGTYFGFSSYEYLLAGYYFAGFDNKNQAPGAMLFAEYAILAVPGYVRGGPGLTLSQVQAMTGTLSITIAGQTYTSNTINLSTATSFSSAAAIIQSSFTSLPGNVTYDTISGAFVITTTTTGPASTITQASGTLGAPLLLTTATGAVLSQGMAADTPATAMQRITATTQNFAGFTTTFDPDNGIGHIVKMQFAKWASQNPGFVYVGWHTDVTATQAGESTALGILLVQSGFSGTVSIYAPVNGGIMGAVKLGFLASVDHNEPNGRINYAYKTQSGVSPDVSDATSASNLVNNLENFYGANATRAAKFNWYYPGHISGPFKWEDSYTDQIWFDDQCQENLIQLLITAKSIPNDPYGDAMIKSSLLDPVQTAVAYGMIQSGVTLSNQQITELKAATGGIDISAALTAVGYYILVVPATPAIRATRGPRQVMIFYTDGGAVNTINLTNTLVQ